jgi:diguanylate cyclase (GGDEF)-like protein
VPHRLKFDSSDLPAITQALSSTRWVLPLPVKLRPAFLAEQLQQRRLHNRRVLLILTIIFDLFWVAQFKSAPEIITLSFWLRAGLMTPAVVAFMMLDKYGRIGRFYSPALVTLAVMAGVISAVLLYLTYGSTHTNDSDIHATPLILLGTGLVARLTPREVLATAGISAGVFILSLFVSPSVPQAEIGSLILMDLSIAAGAIVFNLQLEFRDRRIFLLQTMDAINRAELAARNRGLLQETQTDALTGAANRRCFDDVLGEAWAKAIECGTVMGLIMIDIDHFKLFNDHYGHQGGDECLRMVASTARREVRTSDLFARYGGEEFAVILPGADVGAVLAVASRMRAAVEAMGMPHHGVGAEAKVSISLGIACMTPAESDDVRRLIEMADANLYRAKRAGRNRVCAPEDAAVEAV